MTAVIIALVVLGCMLAGIALGHALQSALPGHHLGQDAKDSVKLAAGLVATLTALVLGLLVSSAAESFDLERAELKEIAARTIVLDRLLAHYGPETKDARESLRRRVVERLELIWPQEGSPVSQAVSAPDADVEGVHAILLELSPRTDAQRQVREEALKAATLLAHARWLLVVQEEDATIPMPFIVILAVWLTVIFISFSLFAPRNPTILIALVVGALSVTGALFLILELGNPYGGVIKLSSTPLRIALEYMGR